MTSKSMANMKKDTTLASQNHYNELIKTQSLFDAITNTVLDAIIVINQEGKIVFWNKASEKIFGYSKEDVLNENLHKLIMPESYHNDYLQGLYHFSNTGEDKIIGTTIEVTAINKDKKEIPVEISVSSVKIDNFWHAVGVIRDITKKKVAQSNYNEIVDLMRAQLTTLKRDESILKEKNEDLEAKEEELIAQNKQLTEKEEELLAQNEELIEKEKEILESTAKLQAISDTALDAIIMINEEGNITFWNEASTTILGYTKDEILQKNAHSIIAPKRYHNDHLKAFEIFKQTGHGNAIGQTLELQALKKDGTEIPIELSLSSIKLNNKWHATGILRDITARKKLEEALEKERENLEKTVTKRTEILNQSLKALEKAHKLKDQFLSNMSHELRTPLNAIIGFTDLLEMQYYGTLTEKQDEYIKLIQSSGKHLLDLINDLLDISKIDAGSMELFFQGILLEELINEAISAFGAQISNKSIELITYITPDITTIETDRRKLLQILLNMLSNAVKYTPVNGKINIKIEKSDDSHLKISIIDTGIGIEKTKIKEIFSEFYQLNQVRDQALGGTGLGLALSKRLTELIGGEIGVESELKIGSTFWITLPIKTT